MIAIEATSLTKRYGRVAAVSDVTFAIPHGEIVGFLGPNGAGKTTTLRMIAGLIRPTSGDARVLGGGVPGASLADVGTMIEEPSFYPYMSGRDNLRHTALLHGGVDAARIEEILAFVGMDAAAGKRVAAYSQGMRQRLGLARALLWRPKVLLLDEPTNGLDPVGIAEIRENLRGIAQGGVTILISSHILAEIEKLVDRVLVIERGTLRFDGSVRALTNRLEAQQITYRLEASDRAALEAALERLGIPFDAPEGAPVRAHVAADSANALIGRLVGEGVEVIEATRETDSLEGAYLRLLREDGRPS